MKNNAVQVFNNSLFGEIRVVIRDNEPWFVGKDVAEKLGYSNSSKAIAVHVDAEDKQFLMLTIAGTQNGNLLKGQTKTAIINESGVYSLILRSKLPQAREFKHWVTSEVLPTIRKQGMYLTERRAEQAQRDPMTFLAEALKVADDVIKKQQTQIAALEPKAKHYDEYMSREDTYTVSATAEMFGVSPSKLFKCLTAAGWLYKPPACAYQIAAGAPAGVFTIRKIYWQKLERGEQIRVLARGLKQIEKLLSDFDLL